MTTDEALTLLDEMDMHGDAATAFAEISFSLPKRLSQLVMEADEDEIAVIMNAATQLMLKHSKEAERLRKVVVGEMSGGVT